VVAHPIVGLIRNDPLDQPQHDREIGAFSWRIHRVRAERLFNGTAGAR
jgi:hypothetical protein